MSTAVAAGVLDGLWRLSLHDGCMIAGSWMLFFLFARVFFASWLFRDYEVKPGLTQASSFFLEAA